MTQPPQPPPPGAAPTGSTPPGPAHPSPGSYDAQPARPGWVAPTQKPGVVALRPLRLSDLFDGAFTTIRRNPAAMVGLAALVNTVFLVLPVLLTLAVASRGGLTGGGRLELSPGNNQFPGSFRGGAATALQYLGTVFTAFAAVLLTGVVVHVVAEAVLGRHTSMGAAWRVVRGRLPRLVLLLVIQFLTGVLLLGLPAGIGVLLAFNVGFGTGLAVGLVLGLLGFVTLVHVQVRYFLLAAPALVLERLGVLHSLRRAGTLSRAQFWRLLGIWLLSALVAGLVGQVIAIPLGLVSLLAAFKLTGTTAALVMVFAGYLSQILVGTLTTPFTSAVAALQYVDQRIRKEGLDVQLIAAAAAEQGPPGRAQRPTQR